MHCQLLYPFHPPIHCRMRLTTGERPTPRNASGRVLSGLSRLLYHSPPHHQPFISEQITPSGFGPTWMTTYTVHATAPLAAADVISTLKPMSYSIARPHSSTKSATFNVTTLHHGSPSSPQRKPPHICATSSGTPTLPSSGRSSLPKSVNQKGCSKHKTPMI